VPPGEAEANESSDADRASDEDVGAGNTDPGEDYEAGGDDGTGFCAGNGHEAEA